jgi:hypothetical protein
VREGFFSGSCKKPAVSTLWVNDAHFAALALEYDATVVTYYSDFGRFSGVRFMSPVELEGGWSSAAAVPAESSTGTRSGLGHPVAGEVRCEPE